MSEVEVRLEEANCYKALLQNSLFEEPGPIAQKVESKVRDFIRKELKILLGLEHPNATVETIANSVFNSKEIEALKALAAKVLERENKTTNIPSVNQTPVSNVSNVPEVKKATIAAVEQPKPASNQIQQSKKGRPRKGTTKPKIAEVEETEIERVMPDGKVHKIKIRKSEQTKNPGQAGGNTLADLQAIADMQAEQARQQAARAPMSGILGIAVHAAQNDLISPYNPNNDEGEQ